MAIATVNINSCPFDGSAPRTYFTSSGHICGKPVMTIHIECPKCGINMARAVECDEEGYTSFEGCLGDIFSLIAQWNHRYPS